MKIGIIAGSQRPDSQSLKVVKYLETRVPALESGVELYTLDLGTGTVPLWDPSFFSADPSPSKEAWAPVSKELASMDGIVVVTPEWHGMVPPALKNFLLLCTSELAHKPGMIVSVSAAMGGSYPMVELRTTGYKNNRICWTPDHVIIRNVGGVMNGGDPAPEEQDIVKRCDYSLKLLLEYAKALRGVRESGAVDLQTYPFGM